MNMVMTAHHYSGENVDGWYGSRKLNGHRAYWDGAALYSMGRYSGPKRKYPPNWWIDQLKGFCPLDGELWHISDTTGMVQSITCQGSDKSEIDPRWEDVYFMVFNKWYHPNSSNWKRWITDHEDLLKFNWTRNIRFLEQVKIKTLEEFMTDLRHKHIGKIEGGMLVNPMSYYEHRRSRNCLKVKDVYETEGTVIGYRGGDKANTGKLGAIEAIVKWDEKVLSVFGGKDFMVGSEVLAAIGGGFSKEQREWEWIQDHYPIGYTIHFSYIGVTGSGIPVSANCITEE